jgi:WD40 repeat protein
VWIFNYNGVSWSQEGSKITPLESQYSIGQHFGVEVSLSASGNVLAVQSTSCNFTLNPETMSTCTYIFYGISPGNWADASVVLNTTVTAVQSVSLTLSEDGSTVAVGIAADNSVCIYSISDDPSAWAPYCIGTGAGDIGFGTSVSLSSSGNVLAVGAVHDGTAGGTFVFVKDVEWSQSQFIGGTSSSGSSLQGSSVAISSDGSTLIVGGDGDDGGIGAEWIFSEISSVSASHQSKPAFFLLLLLLLSLCLY